MHLVLGLILVLSAVCDGQISDCGDSYYNGSYGAIVSPNYPSSYPNNANCTYTIKAKVASNVTLTFLLLDTEYQANCTYDWVQITCKSHMIGTSSRYCGQNTPLNSITLSPCKQVEVFFRSDGSLTRIGFSIRYEITEIECPDNCTLITNLYGFICSCGQNDSNTTMPTAPEQPGCSSDCFLSTNTNSQPYCICSMNTPSTTASTCPTGCYASYDFYGYRSCDCNPSSTTPQCASGCYRTTDWQGYPYCNCPSTTAQPLYCGYGCYQDSDYWGNQFCNCPSSTQIPLYCSSGCYSSTDANGYQYCYCPTTTLPPCFSPCYYTWDYTYDSSGRRICYCPPTTTNPPPTGCNQTLTASFGTITSPNYPLPYTKGVDCNQIITVPTATSINLRIIDLNIYYSNSYSCRYEYIQITGCDGSTSYYCALSSFPTGGLTLQCPDGVSISVLFHTYSTTYYSYRGFKMSYSTDTKSNCSEYSSYLTKGSSGSVTSPNYPSNFPTISECFNYLFTDDDNIKIKITFDVIRLEGSSTCQGVFLKLTCQDDDNGYSQTVCGSRIPPPMTFNCRVLQIWFKSNATTSYSPRSYRLRFYAIDNSQSTKDVGGATNQPQMLGQATDLSESSKLGIGLGVGIGGFFLILLVVIIIIFIVFSQRQAATSERRHMEELSVVCRIMGGSRASDDNAQGAYPGITSEGFSNPLADIQPSDSYPPSYKTDGEASCGSSRAGDDVKMII